MSLMKFIRGLYADCTLNPFTADWFLLVAAVPVVEAYERINNFIITVYPQVKWSQNLLGAKTSLITTTASRTAWC